MKINIRIFTLSYTFKNKPIFLDKNGRYMIVPKLETFIIYCVSMGLNWSQITILMLTT